MSDNNESSVSLQCMADDAEMSSVTVLLSVSPVNIMSLSAVHFTDDVCLQLCVPRAREDSDNIRIHVSVLDFARSALVDVACSVM